MVSRVMNAAGVLVWRGGSGCGCGCDLPVFEAHVRQGTLQVTRGGFVRVGVQIFAWVLGDGQRLFGGDREGLVLSPVLRQQVWVGV